MAARTRAASYASGSGTDALTFRYTLGEADGPWTRAALASNSLVLGDESILSVSGGLAAALAHRGEAHAALSTSFWEARLPESANLDVSEAVRCR